MTEVLKRIADLESGLSPVEEPEDEPDYKAMIEDLEQDFNGTYWFQLSTRSETLKDILKKVRAKHTPQAIKKPEGKDGPV